MTGKRVPYTIGSDRDAIGGGNLARRGLPSIVISASPVTTALASDTLGHEERRKLISCVCTQTPGLPDNQSAKYTWPGGFYSDTVKFDRREIAGTSAFNLS